MSIEVIKPGALTTLQDLGRRGFQHLGVPVNGAMDERSHRLANALVGNAANEGTLEITLMGPALRFTSSAVIAVTGADLDAKLNGEPLTPNTATAVSAGSELAFGKRRSGVRAYLAVRGGFHATPAMGSTSLFARGGYGGLGGKPLAKGSVIELETADVSLPLDRLLAALSEDVLANSNAEINADAPIRVIAGREWGRFDAASQQAFVQQPFRVTPQSDRMGFRLEGPKLELAQDAQMESEALGFGAIQVPADGNPIVLMADRQTTGGYPKIAQVCAVDLPRLAQKMPGESIAFSMIGLADAQRLLLSQQRTFAAWEG
ncbi:5-oxoprolinase subunit C family protein [Paraburkholderia caledonica]|uniref:Urea carboxylase n=1 Tax=Paraburkholderia caledonica TaxID=134536 RepID=A0AB73IPH5_9BURK|nr:urea carboxylase [Paraburkholderia caledonica]